MRRLFILFVASVLLSGCAASVKRSGVSDSPVSVPQENRKIVYLQVKPGQSVATAEDWELFRAEWRTAFSAKARASGKEFEFIDGDLRSGMNPGVLVYLQIFDYRYVSPGARYGFGVFTGNAFINSQAQFHGVPEGGVLGQREYSTSSSAWQGIFSAMTDKQVAAITEAIFGDLGF